AEAAQDAVHRLHQMWLVGVAGEHPADAAGVRERAEQYVGHPAPRRPAMEPVPLGLVAGRVLDLDRLPAAHSRAGLAVGPQPGETNLPGEAHVRALVAEDRDLVEQGGGPDVGVVSEAGDEVGLERLQRIRLRRSPDTGLPRAVEVLT